MGWSLRKSEPNTCTHCAILSGCLHNLRIGFGGNLTARRYIDQILQPHMIPFMQQHPDVTVFQHDNARPHSARLTQAYLEAQGVDVLPWPAYSPDMNPIEHLWDYLGRQVTNRVPQPPNRQQLIQALQQEWVRIPQDTIRHLVRSMRQRIAACIEANGGHTRY